MNKRCLLDMDGVLVNFNDGACRLHGVENPYRYPANHGKYGIEDLIGISRTRFYAPMGFEFWASLDPMPECFEIVKMVEDTFGHENVCILTKPILTYGCHDGKKEWLRQHLPRYFDQCLVGKPKQFCSSTVPESWLIDDSEDNIKAFKKFGNVIGVPRPWNCWHMHPTLPTIQEALKLARLSQDDFKVVGN